MGNPSDTSDTHDPLIGARIGQVEIREYLDQGGMAVVYKGYHTFLEKQIAIKFMSQSLMRSESNVQRFIREAQTIARLNHPNIVQVIDAGQFQKMYYMTMEFLEGLPLDSYVKQRGQIPYEEAIAISSRAAPKIVMEN